MNNTLGLTSASILIVDDQPANVRLLEKTLQQAGFSQLVGYTDSVEALELAKKQRFDLILLDLNMPVVDGFMFLRELKRSFNNLDDFISVLVITAQTDTESRIRALEEGARDFLNKPFDRMELLTRIRNMLEIRVMHNMLKNQNSLLEERVKERTSELENTRLEIIRRLGRAAEYRDNETGFHIVRMSQIAVLVGRALGLNERELEFLLNASPMHDIGKIGIPDKVLLKPGKFTPEEWEIMKTHATIGGELLSGHSSELLETARIIALSHHEKWDGSGYPLGLKSEDIPLPGRIVAIADVFDALTSVRPYKKAWKVEDAILYIREQRGLHFDPKIVDAFNNALPGILQIKEKYPEPS